MKLDHCVIHVSNWEISTRSTVTCGARSWSRESSRSYRFGDEQLNLHGPGMLPAPVAKLPVQPGNSDLCFEWPGAYRRGKEHLERNGVEVEMGPVERSGARGTGTSVYATRMDPSSSSSRTMKRSRARTQHERGPTPHSPRSSQVVRGATCRYSSTRGRGQPVEKVVIGPVGSPEPIQTLRYQD